MTTRIRYLTLTLALAASALITTGTAAQHRIDPGDTQTKKQDTTKTDDKAVKRDKAQEKRDKAQEKRDKAQEKRDKQDAKKQNDGDQRRDSADRRDRDGKGDQRAVQRPPQPPRPWPRHVVERSHVVFVGGYFYDPYFGEYPWWSPVIYPHPRIVFDTRAQVRLQVTPRAAAVFVDGFYAGVVDDFDGFFERLPLLPGGHTITLYLEGFRTISRSIYLAPGTELRIREALVPLPPGMPSEPPNLTMALPPPPAGTYIPPRTAPLGVPQPPPAGSQQASVQAEGFGVLSLRFRPDDAVVTIDGQDWLSSAPGELVVHLGAGRHTIQLKANGRQAFSTEVEIREGETTELNISAPRLTN